MAEAKAWVIIPKMDKSKTGCILEMHPLVLCKNSKYFKHCEGDRMNCNEYYCHNLLDYVPSPDWFCPNGEELPEPPKEEIKW